MKIRKNTGKDAHAAPGGKPDSKRTPKMPFLMSRPKPIVPRRLVAVFTICITIILFYAALTSVLHQRSMYSHITNTTLQQENKLIIDYLDGPVGTDNTLTFLTANEQSHMSDVKSRLDLLFILYITSLGIMLGTIAVFFVQKLWNHFDELLARSLRAMGWTILGISLFFGLAALLNFTKLWVLLHAILFPSGNWMFAYDSTLITLYPEAFFVQFVTRVVWMLTAVALVSLVLSWFMLRMRVHEHNFSAIYDKKSTAKSDDAASGNAKTNAKTTAKNDEKSEKKSDAKHRKP